MGGLMAQIYLVCFDIQQDKPRRRVAKILLAHGERVQYSVFELALTHSSQLQQLKKQLKKHLEPGDDLRFYYLPPNAIALSSTLNEQPVAAFPSAVVL